MFFDTAVFLSFVKDCRAAGITVPIMPGLMVIQSYAGFKRMTAFCRSRVPTWVWETLDGVKVSEGATRDV
jgi:methylenetetrahydrofolate reductase (NADPH)